MAQVAFIGKENILRVFTYFGMAVFQVETPDDAKNTLQELREDKDTEWGLIYVEECLAEACMEYIVELNHTPLPVISIFPSTGEKKNLSHDMLGNLVRKVTGVDLHFD